MMIILGIIVAIMVFSIIILLHEYGHFKSARIFGVKVEEFGLGIPPKARKIFTDKQGTQYTLNWLPIGGFVKLKGENINTFEIYNEEKKLLNNEEIEEKIQKNESIFDKDGEKIPEIFHNEILQKLQDNYSNDSLLTKPYYQQAIIVLGGIFMNFVLAFFIFFIIFLAGFSPIGINNKIETSLQSKIIPTQDQAIKDGILIKNPGVYLVPVKDSLAQRAGIQPYDLLTQIDTTKIDDYNQVKEILSQSPQKALSLHIQRSEKCDTSKEKSCSTQNVILQIIPDGDGKIGSYLGENIELNKDFEYKFGFFQSIKLAGYETYAQISLTFQGIKLMLGKIFAPETPQERQEAIESISGPIGVVDFMSQSIGNGFIFILIIGGIISINLGVFNLLPLPALDGGRFVFIVINGTIQKLFGKKAINEKLEGTVHVLFFLFLIALSIIIAYNDVIKIIER